MHLGQPGSTRGMVIVVAGGPQYRAGAHRQFVSMARKLAGNGHAVLRFDLRGMGDSSGSYLGFEHSVPDIRAAIDSLMAREPQLREVVLIGECESASGILFYAWRDPRVAGAVLVNPWVRTVEGQAQVILKDYYFDRLRSPAFWSKVRSGDFKVAESLASLVDVVRAYRRGKHMFARSSLGHAESDLEGLPLPAKTAAALSRFKGHVLLLMSGHDYIAREFDEVTSASRAWDGLLEGPRIVRKDIAGSDHTFSKRIWKDAASDAIVDWARSW
jgi:exosortase A-associated hydrolase 1